MRRPRRRKVHYTAAALRDGTVIAAYPMRKPAPRILRRKHLKIDEDGVTVEYATPEAPISSNDENRFRFQNIIAISLNTRRAIREFVLPPLADIQNEISQLRAEVQRLRDLLGDVAPAPDSPPAAARPRPSPAHRPSPQK